MKKLLAVMLVLGLASVASAALTGSVINEDGARFNLVINGDQLDVVSTVDIGIIMGIVGDGDVISVIDDATGPAGGNISDLGLIADSAQPYAAKGDGILYLVGSWSAQPVGTVFMSIANPSIPMSIYDCGDGEKCELMATYVPEPMTMSLLGLGGLAMIRRRRA